MNIGAALDHARKGKLVTRKEWISNRAYIRIDGKLVLWGSRDHNEQEWTATSVELLAEDWLVVQPPKEEKK